MAAVIVALLSGSIINNTVPTSIQINATLNKTIILISVEVLEQLYLSEKENKALMKRKE